MTTVYLCVGLQKTGTSALQKFLRMNEAELMKQGYCYPLLKLGIDKKYNDRNGHFLVYRAIEFQGEERKQRELEVQTEAYKMLELLARKYSSIILSDELIWHRSKKIKNFWTKVMDDFRRINCEVKILVYLRRQDLFIQSLWNQSVKAMPRISKSFQECMDTDHFKYYPLNYYEYLQQITNAIGRENLILRVYERGQFEGEGHTLFSDFFKSVHLKLTEDFVEEENERNLALEGNFLEIRRWMNMIPQYKEMEDFMRGAVYHVSEQMVLDGTLKKTNMFSYEEQVAFLQKYMESNRKTAVEYLGRKDGVLFYDPVVKTEQWKLDPENMYRDIVMVMGNALCNQEKKINELEETLKTIDRSLIFRGYRFLQRKLKK